MAGCKHDWRLSNPYKTIIISGEEFVNFWYCTKCRWVEGYLLFKAPPNQVGESVRREAV